MAGEDQKHGTGNPSAKTGGESEGRKLGAAKLSIGINAVFILLKVAVGLISGSIGILAEALHSFLDLLASILAYMGIRKGGEPFDETHPYGHEKFENLSSILQMILIAVTAVIIIYEAAGKLSGKHEVEFEEYGILLMIVTTAGAYYVSRYLGKIGAEEHSHALEADAAHFTSDIWGSAAVMAGLALSRLGFPQGDPLAAIAVALIMLRLSFDTGYKMMNILLEHRADPGEIAQMEGIIKKDGRIVRFHKLRARYIGARIWVDVHIHLKKDIPLKQAHRIAHELKDAIMGEMGKVKEVNIHLEPD